VGFHPGTSTTKARLEGELARQRIETARMKWTRREDKLLLSLKAKGLLIALISKQLGRTEVSVEDRIISLRKRKAAASDLRQWNRPTFAMLNSKAILDRQRVMPKNSNKKWTPEEDERLLELKATGKPHGVIGVGLGRSTGAIIGRLSILNTRTARLKRSVVSEAPVEEQQN
jgi:hypothetical protein